MNQYSKQFTKCFTKQDGFTLVEILVTLVILAVGLLGLAGLQATSLRNTESAYQRSQAAILAYDMLDRMRANSAGVDNGAYNNISTTAASAGTDCAAATCSASSMATYDDAEWHDNIAAVLPGGTGSVTGAGSGSLFTITITWADDRSNNTTTTFTLSSRI